ncbi:MAG: hypothetical protein K6T29_04635 [Peptococcaceae bacterium]|nr:hypothetical protein [Peptococcaceae bacterium]
MFLRGYKIIGVGPCLADGAQFRVTALLPRDISDLMPYLNAALTFCAYEPFGPTLTFKFKGSPVVLQPDRVTVGQLREVDMAEEVLDAVLEFVNRVHGQKERLKPEYTTKELPQPGEIYALLPRSNCGECGEATCIAFTVKLVKGEKRVEECARLSSGQAEKICAILETIDDSAVVTGAGGGGEDAGQR